MASINLVMFAAITPALISGAFAERKKFSAFLTFSLLWVAFVYCPIAHWVWAKGGWLASMGALDFAGGTVVDISSCVSALVCAIVLGQRINLGDSPSVPHNVTMTILGTALLWFGWFGFNGGSALSMGSLATAAVINTHIAATTAGTVWMFASWFVHKRAKAIGAASGVVAGLVAITPAAGFVQPFAAFCIGAIASCACFICVEYLVKPRVDDSLDVFGVHGVGGIVGALLTGVFASVAVNPAGADGLLYGNASLIFTQSLAVVVVASYAALATFGLLKLIDACVGLRVTSAEEVQGLDFTQHGEIAYSLGESNCKN